MQRHSHNRVNHIHVQQTTDTFILHKGYTSITHDAQLRN